MNETLEWATGILVGLLLLATIAALFVPLLRRRRREALQYFISTGSSSTALRLKRHTLLENLRDIHTEHQLGKLTEEEYARLSRPIAQELDELEKIDGISDAKAKEQSRTMVSQTKLGWLCPDCGALNRVASNENEGNESPACIQCGGAFERGPG